MSARRTFRRTPRRMPVGRGFGTRGDAGSSAGKSDLAGRRVEAAAPRRSPLKRQGARAVRGWGIRLKPGPCRNCGAEAVHLHHAVPRSRARAGREDLRNGLPLCANCHNAWHAGMPLCREVFTSEEWVFVCTLAGLGWLARHYPKHDLEAAA